MEANDIYPVCYFIIAGLIFCVNTIIVYVDSIALKHGLKPPSGASLKEHRDMGSLGSVVAPLWLPVLFMLSVFLFTWMCFHGLKWLGEKTIEPIILDQLKKRNSKGLEEDV